VGGEQEYYCKAFVFYLLPVGLCFGYDAIQVRHSRFTPARFSSVCASEDARTRGAQWRAESEGRKEAETGGEMKGDMQLVAADAVGKILCVMPSGLPDMRGATRAPTTWGGSSRSCIDSSVFTRSYRKTSSSHALCIVEGNPGRGVRDVHVALLRTPWCVSCDSRTRDRWRSPPPPCPWALGWRLCTYYGDPRV